jgi:hypothetical protein
MGEKSADLRKTILAIWVLQNGLIAVLVLVRNRVGNNDKIFKTCHHQLRDN